MATNGNENDNRGSSNNNTNDADMYRVTLNKSHPSYVFLKKLNEYPYSFLQYYRLWLQSKAESENNMNIESDVYEPSYIENVYWTSLEKQRFFTALERCGPYQYEEIQKRIGPTKTVLQVRIYAEYLKMASEVELNNDNDDVIENIPYASEMSNHWIKKEERLANKLSTFVDNQSLAINEYIKSVVYERIDLHRFSHQHYVSDTEFKLVKYREKIEDNGIEFDKLDDLINMSALSSLALKYNHEAIVTEETKFILHKLLIRFLKDVMINLIALNRRDGRHLHRRVVKRLHLLGCIPKKCFKGRNFIPSSDYDVEMDDNEDTDEEEGMDDSEDTFDDDEEIPNEFKDEMNEVNIKSEVHDIDDNMNIKNEEYMDEHQYESNIKNEAYGDKIDINQFLKYSNILNEEKEQTRNDSDDDSDYTDDLILYEKEMDLLNSSDDNAEEDGDNISESDSYSNDDENVSDSEIVFLYKEEEEEVEEEEEFKKILEMENSLEFDMVDDDCKAEKSLRRIVKDPKKKKKRKLQSID